MDEVSLTTNDEIEQVKQTNREAIIQDYLSKQQSQTSGDEYIPNFPTDF